MELVVMVEERSAKELLEGLLPKILPNEIGIRIIPHEGKSDLEKSIPKKLRSWQAPNARFVILHDQDSADCVALKKKLQSLCDFARDEVLVRIACVELEAWYFGDPKALASAYEKSSLATIGNKKKYRHPDKIQNPKDELKKLLPQHQQISGARLMAKYMDIDNNSSQSFNTFVDGLRRICGIEP